MDCVADNIEVLKKQIIDTEKELHRLRDHLARIEAQKFSEKESKQQREAPEPRRHLLPEEYRRYGRQMIVPTIGIQGQLNLKSASVLIIGAGGLGCPAAAYLAGAGVGRIGLVDGDVVEVSNLHRQIIHNCSTIGMYKVDSAVCFLKRLNPHCKFEAYPVPLKSHNAERIVSEYDLVLDCTDHPTSRYLISDITSLLQKPLLSASALRGDGQLLTLSWPPLPAGDETGGPCYRCIFPKPPPPDSVISCRDGGIVGPVVGLMGVLQAVEAIRLLTSGKLAHTRSEKRAESRPTMLLFSASMELQFKIVRLRGRRKDCLTCSNQAVVSLEKLRRGEIDYDYFCGLTSSDTVLLDDKDRLEPYQYLRQRNEGIEHLLIDVREKVQYDICSLPGSINVPFSKLQSQLIQRTKEPGKLDWLPISLSPKASIYIICRLGNDSQVITKKLKEIGLPQTIKDIAGGFKAWREQIDESWPEY